MGQNVTIRGQDPWGIHWFRRDLRLPGNEALRQNWRAHAGRVLGLFCFDAEFLRRPDFSHNRFAFFLKTLSQLRLEMRRLGGDLLVVDAQPHVAFAQILAHLESRGVQRPHCVSWNRDYEPFARARDERFQTQLSNLGIQVQTQRDHLVFEPHEIQKDTGGFYQVYSPFLKRWQMAVSSPEGQKRLEQAVSPDVYLAQQNTASAPTAFHLRWTDWRQDPDFPYADALDRFIAVNDPQVTIPIPEAGLRAGWGRWRHFQPQLPHYATHRDLPAVKGTSGLSLYFKNGSVVPTQVLGALDEKSWRGPSGLSQFVKEIAWREFYYHILFHRPEVEHKSFLPQYENLNWSQDLTLLQRWQEGTTGFPIVDAGMRELRTTGWMHNRVRMIVASFLTKDLLLDWRLGERHFMKYLLDGDLAPNNGGWQWAASTGCDPQPYFRIFNPWLQSKKFDPQGEYIRRFVPELKEAPAAALHHADAERTQFKYPAPIVRHDEQRAKALALFQISTDPNRSSHC